MIEEIQALMPILDKISDGALWAFVIFMFVKTIGIVVWPIVLSLMVIKVATKISMFSAKQEVDLYKLQYKGTDVVSYIGDKKTLEKFFSTIGGSTGYVHGSDLRKIMKDWNK